jgi:hypothetical protein
MLAIVTWGIITAHQNGLLQKTGIHPSLGMQILNTTKQGT